MLRQSGRQVVGTAEIEQGAHRSIEGPGAYGSTSPSDCVYVASNVNGTWQFSEKPIPLSGDGQNGRDWPYAEDHVGALLPAATQGPPGAA